MGDFDLHNRKISPYIPRNEFNSASNRKISAYISLLDPHSIKDMPFYLREVIEFLKLRMSMLYFEQCQYLLAKHHPQPLYNKARVCVLVISKRILYCRDIPNKSFSSVES